MKHATLDDLNEIYANFQKRKDVFPHVRQDKIKRMIEAGQVVAGRRHHHLPAVQEAHPRGRGDIPAGAIMLHQILNTDQFNGAGGEVFRQFVDEIVKSSGGDLYLSVRRENAVACRFYERHGMKVAGTVTWKNRTIPGLVYRLLPRRARLNKAELLNPQSGMRIERDQV